ncbi:MAG: serpin family protein [Candidatus Eisenbacteria bacterium]
MRTREGIRPKSSRRTARMVFGTACLVVCLVPPGFAGSEAGTDLARSAKTRLSAPPAAEARVPELVEGNTEFALRLYRELLETGENLVLSPHGLSIGLAAAYAGARGETERQMADALRFGLPHEQLHRAFNALDQSLAGRGEGLDERSFRLRLAAALWAEEGHELRDSYLDILAGEYGAGVRAVDFARPEEARRAINGWAVEKTAGRVGDLLPPGSIDRETALVLTQAVFFRAAWAASFPEAATREAPFDLLEGGTANVPMMSQLAELEYAERDGVQAIGIPYFGNEVSMVILLPERGSFAAFAAELDAGELNTILGEMKPAFMRFEMPKFRVDSGLGLRNALMELGMIDAFGAADFSGMDGTRELFIDDVFQGASIRVDEAGTEAAAAGAVVMKRKGAPPEREVRVDRPFLFLIRDIETGAILFLGHVVNPEA